MLGKNQPFYGLQSLGLNPGETPLTRISDMAAAYVAALKTVQSQGPYRVGGWSLGAFIAFEMARQLQEEGEVAILLLLDMPTLLTSSRKNIIAGLPILFWWQTLWEIWPYVTDYWRLYLQSDNSTMTARDDRPRFAGAIARRVKRLSSLIASIGPLAAVLRGNMQAFLDYTPKLYNGEITLLRTESSVGKWVGDPTLGWQEFSRQAVQVHFVPGHHLTLLRSPHVQKLAEILQTCLDRPQ